MRAPVLGSIAVHALLGAVLLAAMRHAGSREAPVESGPALELVTISVAPPVPAAPPAAPAGGAPSRRSASPARSARRTALHADPVTRTAVTTRLESLPRDGLDGAGTGDDAGRGGAGGDGHGLGRGLDLPPAPPPPPPPPVAHADRPRSKARPARLIYPGEHELEATLRLARVIVDDDGFVVGVHLLGELDPQRAGDAEHGLWRFRYAPALDDDGRPIQSTVDQPFQLP